MPALLTHYLCGDMVLKSIDAPGAADMIIQHRNLFNLGTQGPDIFFYHNALPWVKGESLSKLGGKLHSEKVRMLKRKYFFHMFMATYAIILWMSILIPIYFIKQDLQQMRRRIKKSMMPIIEDLRQK